MVGSTESFYVYEHVIDRPVQLTIHRGRCRDCNYGEGKKGKARRSDSTRARWSPAFYSLDTVRKYAKQKTGKAPWHCKHCLPEYHR
jgi:hypothetical protein